MGRMKYIKPEVEILDFEFEGVIAASSEGGFDDGMDNLPSHPGFVPDPVDNIWDDKWL